MRDRTEALDGAMRACRRSAAISHLKWKRGMGGLASIGSTAAWVGIFGTLQGIVTAFKNSCGMKPGRLCMLDGLTEALLPCAFGLLVALAATWCYRYLLSEVEELDSDMEIESLQLINDLGRLGWNRFEVALDMRPVRKTEALYAAGRASMRSASSTRLELSRGLNSLASIASTAPWVGMLGVVLGIYSSFGALNGSKSSMMAHVFDGLSLALLSCAFGLLVALAAVWSHRYLLSEVEDLNSDMKNATLQLTNDIGRLNGTRSTS